MPLELKPALKPNEYDVRSKELYVGRIMKSPEGGWFWSISCLAQPPQGKSDTLDAAKRDLEKRWEDWKRWGGLK